MEVRKQGIDPAERETRRYEERRAPAQRAATSNRLEHTHGRRAHGQNTACAGDPTPGTCVDLVPLAMKHVLLQARGRHRRERIEAHVQRHTDGLDVSERVGCEVQPRGRGGDRAQLPCIHSLVPVGILQRLADIRRKRGFAIRLAVKSDEPPPAAKRLDKLNRSEPLPSTQSARGASERFPHALARDSFKEQYLHGSAGGATESKPRRHYSAVVDHDELIAEEIWEIRKERVLDGGRGSPVHQQPRRIARLDRSLGDQRSRQLVVELSGVHPARRVASRPMDSLALERARQRIAGAVAGRPEPAALEAALQRSRSQIEALAVAAAELETSIPVQVGNAVRDGIRAEVLPVARHIAEIRGLLNQAIRRLERLEGDLLAERHARVDDLALLVDLVSSGWKGVDTRLERLERAQAEAVGSLTHVEALVMNGVHERVAHAAAA